jgi:hypothetical protein
VFSHTDQTVSLRCISYIKVTGYNGGTEGLLRIVSDPRCRKIKIKFHRVTTEEGNVHVTRADPHFQLTRDYENLDL